MPSTADEKKQKTRLLKRNNILTSVNLIHQFAQNYNEDTDACQISIWLERLDALWEDFHNAQTEVEVNDDSENGPDTHLKERVDFETKFYKTKGFLLSKVHEAPTVINSSIRISDPAVPSHPVAHVKLPQINLPRFSGRLEDWLTFHDHFVSLIHTTDLPVIEKFQYLRGQLDGEARGLIDTLSLTQANYPIAWELLSKRYSNSKLLKKRHVQILYDLPKMGRQNGAELHKLVETFERTIKVLSQLGEPTDSWDTLLIPLLTQRLDKKTHKAWEEYCSERNDETTDMLIGFLHRKVQILEAVTDRPSAEVAPAHTKKQIPTSRISSHGAFYQTRCIACNENHLLYQCQTFGRLNVEDREKLLRKHSLCRNCFKRNHLAKDCSSKASCRNCQGRHHTLVCLKPKETPLTPKTPHDIAGSSNQSNQTTRNESNTVRLTSAVSNKTVNNSTDKLSENKVLLATALVFLLNEHGVKIPVRALLDSGSECHFLTERTRQQLKLPGQRCNLPIAGIGEAGTHVRSKVRAVLKSRISEYQTTIEMLVLPRVTINLPSTCIDSRIWPIPSGIALADPSFNESSPIDLIIGAEVFFQLFTVPGQINLGPNAPLLINSCLGWVFSGKVTTLSSRAPQVCNVAINTKLEDQMAKFWELEEGGFGNKYSVEEMLCEQHYQANVKRHSDGRYVVRLPVKHDVLAKLGDSKSSATQRMIHLEKRLVRDPQLSSLYHAFMDEYISLGHMRKIDASNEIVGEASYYLPHHPVVKLSSSTTKVRGVFDASSKTSSGVSLNDALLIGPVVQSDLRAIIMRSRIHPILLISDVEKMYRQISIADEDMSLQRIIWRKSPLESFNSYELTTVTYGTAAAPYLATRTLIQLSIDEGEKYPLAAKAVVEDCYVDDIITGASSVNDAIKMRKELNELMGKGKFHLRKWASNSTEVLHGIPSEEQAFHDPIELDRGDTIKTLGLIWEPRTDCFLFKIQQQSENDDQSLTKRTVLSRIAQIHDPLGLVGPVITMAKCFMQELWRLKTGDTKPWGWDNPLPRETQVKWMFFENQLPQLNLLRLNRHILLENAVEIQIHCFSDASETAYGCCIYIRSQNIHGSVKVGLLTSRSRVAPLNKQSIPRLELCGALLAAELHERVVTALKLSARSFFWTDSSIVLQWLEATPGTWHTFVANRVAKIQQTTKGCIWNHIKGVQNPADLISRGMYPIAIIEQELWWNGPAWLRNEEDEWPINNNSEMSQENPLERRKIAAVVISTERSSSFIDEYLSSFSNYQSMLRCTGVWRRYFRILQDRYLKGIETLSGSITRDELRTAELSIVRLVQMQVYPFEYKCLINNQPVQKKSPLRWFNPTMQLSEGVIRVGGRLQHSMEPDNMKHPMIIPSTHHFSRLLFECFHRRLLHAGPQLLLNTIRLHFWPLGGRNLARVITNRCVTCFRAKPSLVQQAMGNLPAQRVTAARPFSITGVDYFGPVWIKPSHRKASPIKAYVAVFICFVSRAVHLELVPDLSTQKFIQALRRFVARRGKCSDLYSDNATNFVGARNELKEIYRLVSSKEHNEQLAKECAANDMKWHFIPPRAPHFGGLWEAAVRSCKYHIIRVLGTSTLAHDDLLTLLCQVECCLNSRPIIPLSDDPLDLESLTPGHFLTGSSLQMVQDTNLLDVPVNRLKNWQLVQQLIQRFWKRWHVEYLSHLQVRPKWCQPPVWIHKGQLVILREDNQPPMHWPMARIEETHPGPDGIVRVVTLRTSSGMMKRPVTRIAVLPQPETD